MDNQTPNEQKDVRPPQVKLSTELHPPASGPLAPLESWLYGVLVVKAPYQLPIATKEWIVRYWPWIVLAVAVLLLLTVMPGLMAAITLSGVSATYGGLYGAAVAASIGPMFYIALIALAVQLVIMFVSVPMLLKRQRVGWLLVFYAGVAAPVYGLFSAFSYGYFNFGGFIMQVIGAIIGLYFIFQIRSYYTGLEGGHEKSA